MALEDRPRRNTAYRIFLRVVTFYRKDTCGLHTSERATMVRRSSSVYRWILTTIVVLATVPSLASGQSSLSTSEICPDELAACLGNADCVECQESINLLGQCGVDVTTSVYDSTKISDLVSPTTSLAVSTEISEVACDDVSDLYCCVSTYTDCLANDVAAEYLGKCSVVCAFVYLHSFRGVVRTPNGTNGTGYNSDFQRFYPKRQPPHS